MPRPANVLHLGIKELRSLWRDKMLLIIIVWMFTGGIYAVTTAASMELHNAPIAVVDEDDSALSLRLINAFYPPYFKTPVIISPEETDPLLDAGAYTFVLDIPPEFEQDVLAGRNPDLQVNIDATRMSQAFIGAGYIQNIALTEVAEFVRGYRNDAGPPLSLVTRVKFNPNLTSAWFGSVMELINNVTMLSIILVGAALVREREHGTLEHLLVMPVTASEIMLSKVWSMSLVLLVAVSLSLYLVIHQLLNVPLAGSIPLFLVGAVTQMFAAASIGIFLGTVAGNMPQLGLLMILVLLPLQMLSGGVTPRESMPALVQDIMLLAPTTHFVDLAQAILYRGAGFSVVWPKLLAIAGTGVGFAGFALALFRRSLARAQ